MSLLKRLRDGEYDAGSLYSIASAFNSNVARATDNETGRANLRKQFLRDNMGPEGANLILGVNDPEVTRSTVDRLPNTSAYKSNIPIVAQPSQVKKTRKLYPGFRVDITNNVFRLITNVVGKNASYFYVPVFTRKDTEVGKYVKQRIVLTNITGNPGTITLTVNDRDVYTINSTTGYFSCPYEVYAGASFCRNKIEIQYTNNDVLDLYMQQFDYWKPDTIEYKTFTGPVELRAEFNPIGHNTTNTTEGLCLKSMDMYFNESHMDPMFPYKIVTCKGGCTYSDDTFLAGSKVHLTNMKRFDGIYSNYTFNNYPSSKPNMIFGTRESNEPCYIARIAYFKRLPVTS